MAIKKDKKDKEPKVKAVKSAKPKAKSAKRSKDKKGSGPVELKTPSASQIKLMTALPFLEKSISKNKDMREARLSLATKASMSKHMPQVNLLPEEVTLAVVQRRTKFTLMLTAVAVALVVVLTWLTQSITISAANNSFLAVQKQVAEAQAKTNSYAPIQKYFDGLKARVDLANSKIGKQIDYSRLMTSTNQIVSSKATLTNFSTKLIIPPDLTKGPAPLSLASQCGGNNDPFSADKIPLVACISFGGSVTDRNQLGEITTALTAIPFLSNVTLTQLTQNGINGAAKTSIVFSGTAAVNNKILLPSSVVIK